MADLHHTMRPNPPLSVHAFEAVLGIAAFVLLAQLDGVREAWDSSYYFPAGYAFFALVTLIAAWRYRRGWSHGLIIMLAQGIPFAVMAPSGAGALLPGLLLLLLLSLPLVILGTLTALVSAWWMRRRTPVAGQAA